MPINEDEEEEKLRLAGISLRSILVLNNAVAAARNDLKELKEEVVKGHKKMDEVILIGTEYAAYFHVVTASVKLATKALVAIALASIFSTLGHSALVEMVLHNVMKGLGL